VFDLLRVNVGVEAGSPVLSEATRLLRSAAAAPPLHETMTAVLAAGVRGEVAGDVIANTLDGLPSLGLAAPELWRRVAPALLVHYDGLVRGAARRFIARSRVRRPFALDLASAALDAPQLDAAVEAELCDLLLQDPGNLTDRAVARLAARAAAGSPAAAAACATLPPAACAEMSRLISPQVAAA